MNKSMANNAYSSTIADYLTDVDRVPFAIGPQTSNGSKKRFAEERDKRNREFGIIIRKYHSHEKKLLKEIESLEQRAKQEIGSVIPEGYTPVRLIKGYEEKIESARRRLDYHRKICRPEYIQAKQELSQSCLRLVVNIAKYYGRKYGVCINDLIGDGNVGLMHAAEKYNPKHTKEGIKFSTYANWWITQSVIRGLHGEMRKDLPISHRICQDNGRITRTEDMLKSELEREPTEEEITERFNSVHGAKNPYYRISINTIKALRKSKNFLRLVAAKSKGDENLDIKDENIQSSYEIASRDEEIQTVLDYLNKSEKFTFNEGEVIRHRFGLEGRVPKTLDKTGKILGLTRERIRQIELHAIHKLRIHLNLQYRVEFIKKENEK